VELRAMLGTAAALLVICICSAPAEADNGSPTIGELKQLNVEDLMNIQVTSVHHPEYGAPDPAHVEIQRSVHGKVAWRY
jgi:hypothetical protein